MFGATQLPRTLDAALRDLGSEKTRVRASAARDLGLYAEDARDRVIHALKKAIRDDEAEVRAAAATTLADLQAAEALPDLLLAVEDESPLARQMAITALGEIGDPRATERLRRALGDPRADVRFQAAIAFPRVSASREAAIEALLAATRDEDALVCHIALRMAEELSSADGEDGGVDARVLVRARALLAHDAAEVRVASAILLAAVETPGSALRRASEEILVQVASGGLKTRDREDEAAAIELAGALGLEAARPGLERRAFGGLLGLRRDPLAWHARVALARMGHARACREILRELSAADRDLRTLAVAAAGRARLAAAREPIAAMRGDEARADPDAVAEALAILARPQAAEPA
jgi:hypothetical protein